MGTNVIQRSIQISQGFFFNLFYSLTNTSLLTSACLKVSVTDRIMLHGWFGFVLGRVGWLGFFLPGKLFHIATRKTILSQTSLCPLLDAMDITGYKNFIQTMLL